MKVQILQEDLLKTLNTSIRFINTRGTLPILNNFLLVAENSYLKILATNLEMSISMKLGAKVEKEGRVAVPAKILVDIVSNLNKGQIDLELDKENLKVSAEGFEGTLLITPPNDFPVIPDSIEKEKSITLVSSDLQKSLSKVLLSASLDETRPVLGGVLFAFNQKTLSLVASDGFRLSRKLINGEKDLGDKKIIIPRPFLLELLKISKEEREILLEVKDTENQAIIKVGDVFLTTRLIDGNFPDYEKIIPAGTSVKISVDKNDLSKAVKLAAIFARDEGNVIRISVGNNELQIKSEGPTRGKEESKIAAKVEGSPVEILYNFKFVEEFINISDADNIEIKLVDATSASIFIDPKDPDLLHLIMPVRISS